MEGGRDGGDVPDGRETWYDGIRDEEDDVQTHHSRDTFTQPST